MKKEIREVRENLIQITTTDERWYTLNGRNPETGLPELQFVPSVTWIAGCYPKGVAFYKWLAENGWDESQAIKNAAAEKGSKVHKAIEALIGGATVAMEAKFPNPATGQEETLSVEEYECLMAFAAWWKERVEDGIKVLSTELTVLSEAHRYAGTIDLVAMIGGELYIVDFKTGQSVWPEYELQVSAYKEALRENFPEYQANAGMEPKLAVLQIGYKRNKAGWKWNDLEDKFDLFLAAKKIWANEHSNEKPKQKDYPLSITLAVKATAPEASEDAPVAKPKRKAAAEK